MRKHDMENGRRPGIGWSLGLSYLSALLLVVLATLVVVLMTVCSERFMTKEVTKSAFPATTYALLCENYKSYAAATGFEPEVLTDAINEAQIAADMQDTITRMYAGDTAFDKHYGVSNDIYDAMQADLAARGIEVTDTVQTGIALVADACRSDYANYVTVPLAGQFYTLQVKISRWMTIGIAITAVFAALALFLLVRLSPDPRSGVRCLCFAFITAAGLCLLLALALYPALKLSGIPLNPTSLRLLVLRYVQDIFGRFGVFAVAYGALAGLLLLLTGAAKVKARRR